MLLSLRRLLVAVLVVGSASWGCTPKPYDLPTVDAFNGRLTHNGKPVSFTPEENTTLKVFHEKARAFGIPIQPDGTFKIGWMPIGKYAAMLIRDTKKREGPQRTAAKHLQPPERVHH